MNDFHTLRLILGDQLHEGHSWWKKLDPKVLYVMMEIRPESLYVTHHIQKIVGIFAAMRHFAQSRKADGHQLVYFGINDPHNQHDFILNIRRMLDSYPSITHIE